MFKMSLVVMCLTFIIYFVIRIQSAICHIVGIDFKHLYKHNIFSNKHRILQKRYRTKLWWKDSSQTNLQHSKKLLIVLIGTMMELSGLR